MSSISPSPPEAALGFSDGSRLTVGCSLLLPGFRSEGGPPHRTHVSVSLMSCNQPVMQPCYNRCCIMLLFLRSTSDLVRTCSICSTTSQARERREGEREGGLPPPHAPSKAKQRERERPLMPGRRESKFRVWGFRVQDGAACTCQRSFMQGEEPSTRCKPLSLHQRQAIVQRMGDQACPGTHNGAPAEQAATGERAMDSASVALP